MQRCFRKREPRLLTYLNKKKQKKQDHRLPEHYTPKGNVVPQQGKQEYA